MPAAPTRYALSFDRAYMVIDAAKQGLGIALDSNRMAEPALRRGDLIPVFHDLRGIEVQAHHLVFPRQHGQWSRVARFVDWVRGEART